ncbi:MAG: hypothetical protein WBD46_00600, partial [Acidobacteriaceae bacterium]
PLNTVVTLLSCKNPFKSIARPMTNTLAQRSVTVTPPAKIDGKWRRVPAAYGRNGRIRPGYAQLGDQQLEFVDPAY